MPDSQNTERFAAILIIVGVLLLVWVVRAHAQSGTISSGSSGVTTFLTTETISSGSSGVTTFLTTDGNGHLSSSDGGGVSGTPLSSGPPPQVLESMPQTGPLYLRYCLFGHLCMDYEAQVWGEVCDSNVANQVAYASWNDGDHIITIPGYRYVGWHCGGKFHDKNENAYEPPSQAEMDRANRYLSSLQQRRTQ